MDPTKRTKNPPVEMRVCRAIRLLAEGWSADEVARAVRVRPATLAAWQADDDFRVLLTCVTEAGQVHDALEALDDLTPGAIAALRRALEGDDMALAVRAAHEVLERVGLLPGTYYLDVGARSRGRTQHDYWRRAKVFRTYSALSDLGIVRLPHTWHWNGRLLSRVSDLSSVHTSNG